MFGGDETGAIVIDVGSCTSKFGFGGEDAPKAVFSSLVGSTAASSPAASSATPVIPHKTYIGPTARPPHPGMDLKCPLDYGYVDNWDALEAVWRHGLRELRCDEGGEHPLLLSEAPLTFPAQRERMVEMLFESFNAPAVYLARAPTLAAFSVGLSNAVVIDMGASCTRVTPVYDGYTLNRGFHLSEVGGNFISTALHDALTRAGVEVHPQYMVQVGPDGVKRALPAARAGVTASYHTARVLDVMHDMKSTVCVVHETGYDDTAAGSGGAAPRYELPDGSVITVPASLHMTIPELHFRHDPDVFKSLLPGRATSALMTMTQLGVTTRLQLDKSTSTPVPLHHAVHGALLSSPADTRRDLCNHILLTGGGSLLTDLHKRLHWELLALIPAAFKPRIIAPHATERQFANWIGGSVLSSLGTFQQMWLSRAEYEEEGAAAVERKCA